ncbi:hypothetical protein [Paenibacillus koleovorans]|uniref:hypothetical protein n=1 Tax=Paenibacillus koleovorans TaxID=121608 RepID=UPI000FDBAC9D|nr:hypothetical protein [Paenibacillus koleovorans]
MLLAKGISKFGVSRRKLMEEGVKWKPTYDTEIDDDLFVIQLVDEAKAIKGILYSIGCHSTSMSSDNYLISNDYPGKTSSYLEETYPGTMAVFLQGSAGEIKPLKCAVGDDFISCTFEQMEQAGVDLAKDIIRVPWSEVRTFCGKCQHLPIACAPTGNANILSTPRSRYCSAGCRRPGSFRFP